MACPCGCWAAYGVGEKGLNFPLSTHEIAYVGTGLKTFFVSRFQYYLRDRSGNFEGVYAEWRALRIRAIVRHYGGLDFFAGKALAELGAGYGATGAFFATAGAKVYCVEGRESNTRVIRRRHPQVAALTHDLNTPIPDLGTNLDVILHMGVLYHLRDPEASSRDSCRRCAHLVLETECSDSDDPDFTTSAREPAFFLDQSLDGVGSRPSPAFVERILREEGMQFQMLNDASCNVERHEYDWPIRNTRTFRNGLRRLWFAKKA